MSSGIQISGNEKSGDERSSGIQRSGYEKSGDERSCRLFVARSLYPMATKGHPGLNRSGTNGLATIRLAGKFGCNPPK